MPARPRPQVTVAIPLFRSRRFLDRVVANVEAIELPDARIVLSDRHGDDDALEALHRRFRGDPRIELRQAIDRLGWVDHYNTLLRESDGTYFLWMPHDDEFPRGYVRGLVERLEAHPESVLAFGRMELGERPPPRARPSYPPPVAEDDPWTPEVAIRLLTRWNLGFAFRGVFRRDKVVEAGHFIRPTYDSVRADLGWMFGLALLGRFCYVPTCVCIKHFDTRSVHRSWRQGIRTDLSELGALHGYLRARSRAWTRMEWEILAWTGRRQVRRWRRRARRLSPRPPDRRTA